MARNIGFAPSYTKAQAEKSDDLRAGALALCQVVRDEQLVNDGAEFIAAMWRELRKSGAPVTGADACAAVLARMYPDLCGRVLNQREFDLVVRVLLSFEAFVTKSALNSSRQN
jgi:hypothetical protein